MSNGFHWYNKNFDTQKRIRVDWRRVVSNKTESLVKQCSDDRTVAWIKLSSIIPWNRNLITFPWIFYAQLSQSDFSLPYLRNRKSSSVALDRFPFYNISNWCRPHQLSGERRKKTTTQIKLFHCRWIFIILSLIYNTDSVLLVSVNRRFQRMATKPPLSSFGKNDTFLSFETWQIFTNKTNL